MQDVRAITAGVGGGGGDRRLRHHNNQTALKCPRCDSFNTKFCYYNNYNLSQPRYFCKSCRRYWTKGGVLRNVPIGGGCRKTKRSRQKTSASTERSSSNDSSSLAVTAADTKSAPSTTAAVSNLSDYRNRSYDHPVNQSMDVQIFPTEIGSFTNPTGYGMVQRENQAPGLGNSSPSIVGTKVVEEFRLEEIRGEMNNVGMETAEVDGGRSGAGAGSGGDQELFDLTAAVDPAFWSQPEWTDGADQSFNFLSYWY